MLQLVQCHAVQCCSAAGRVDRDRGSDKSVAIASTTSRKWRMENGEGGVAPEAADQEIITNLTLFIQT